MNKLNKDGVFDTLSKKGTTVSTLEETSSHMEVAYELDNPMVISVLIMFHMNHSTPILKARTEAAFKTFITSTRRVSEDISENRVRLFRSPESRSYELLYITAPRFFSASARFVVAVDTLSVPNLVDKRLVALHPEWERVEQPGADRFVSSSGHSLNTFGLYKIGLYFEPDDFDIGVVVSAYAVDMDHLCFDARMILGSNSMQKMGANISWSVPRLDITDCGLKVPLRPLCRGRASPVCSVVNGLDRGPQCHPFDEIEARFLKGTDHEIETFCLKQLEGRDLPSLSFELKPGTHPYQADRSYTVPSGLREATNRAIDNEIAKGHWYELDENDLEPDAWVSPAFVKKKDRMEDDLPVVRVLVDLRLLNAAIQIDQHLREGQLIPNQDRFIRSIPQCTGQYSIIDVSSAFHGCRVASPCQKWLTFRLNGRLIRSRTCSQGLGLSALFWGRHLDTSLSYVYGGYWKNWMALFVDDFLVHAETEDRCRLRRRLVEIALKCMRKEVSDKVPSCISPSVTAIGLFFEGPFYRVSDANLEKLKTLFRHQPKNSTEVKRLIGSINWASTAFRGGTFSALGDELRILHDISTMKKFSWNDTQGPDAVSRLCNMMTTENLALHGDLDEVNGCTGGYSWVVQTDASGYAAGGALYRAKADVLFDPSNAGNPEARLEGAALVSIWSKALTGAQQRWHTVEKEAYAIYSSAKRWIRLWISTTRLVDHAMKGKLGPSIVIWADSTTAIRQWQTLKVPHDPAASLKAKRFISWSENIAALTFLDHTLEHVPGARNTIADMLSRLGDEYASQSLPERFGAPACAALPGGRPDLRPAFDVDEALCEKIVDAYAEDETLWQGVTVAEIYNFLTHQKDSLQDRTGTIKSWTDAGLFVLSDQMLLFTAAVYAGTRSGFVLVVPVDCEANLLNDEVIEVYDGLRYLREQLLYLSHDELLSGATHMSVGASMNVLCETAWWPGMMSDMKRHVSQCPVCSTSTRRLRKQVPARPPLPYGRFEELQIDHKELPPPLKERLTGIHETGAVLSMVDRLTGELALEYVKNKSALVTAQTVVRRWFCKRGVCRKLSSDNGPGFIADLSKLLGSVLGYRLKFSCVRHPQGSANVERANSAITTALTFINESGDCEDIGDLEMHLASAEFAYNYNSGVFRRLFGEDVPTPLTSNRAGPPHAQSESIELSDADETKLVKMVTDFADDFVKEHSAESAIKGHYNLFNRVAESDKKSGSFLSCKVGDIVLYQGVEDSVKSLTYDMYSGRILSVRLDSGVRVHPTELTSAGDARPIMQPALNAQKLASGEAGNGALFKTGECVLYEIPTQDVSVSDDVNKAFMIGRVIDCDAEAVRVHVHDGGEKSKAFLPLWCDDSAKITRSKTAPPNTRPVLRLVPPAAVLFKVQLRADYSVTSNSRTRMNAVAIGDWIDPGAALTFTQD
ncbi:gag/pol/env polyprotein, putative [Perkinsus marinus ATCC 50983]|uniref:Gag/pol/env polyprotein, putative n=1 Tax=Perkinsus marinus (strain ATCC 50983 / TXsc) TaxID=423536 RepID=C5LHU7_PERM5|nr:gag/pol/env polyprotein, putative [Perkinsus marinus ATCC 50983]EER03701.1 gag/pol/env polyprotein, putative [Perkinsus marinus ATCC 50983]|eukprot:XP_002771885.1 gag/pol/env polyprotein, putative [Perkinsus marinus ATCC 50983]